MEPLIKQLTLDELKAFMKKEGHQLELDEINGGPGKGDFKTAIRFLTRKGGERPRAGDELPSGRHESRSR